MIFRFFNEFNFDLHFILRNLMGESLLSFTVKIH